MAKILLVIDDYNELLYIETLLKRMGFDVLALNKDANVADSVLGFFPELVLATLKGPMVDGVKVSVRVKKQAPGAKVVLLYPENQSPQLTSEQKSKVDALIETPVQPQDTLLIMAQLLKMDGEALIEKFEKLSKARTLDRKDEVRILKNTPAPPGEKGGAGGAFTAPPSTKESAQDSGTKERPIGALPQTEREKRYDQMAAAMNEPVDRVVPHARMENAAKALAEASRGEDAEIEEINRQKQGFVRAMMKKPKG
jgi:CheY-like chemotaxis protein